MEAFAAGCGEDLREGLEGAGWVEDGVVEGDDGCGGEIFCYAGADVGLGMMLRVGGAERALVAAKKCRASGARRFFLYAYPGLTAWAKL
jgi:hypothetical protein